MCCIHSLQDAATLGTVLSMRGLCYAVYRNLPRMQCHACACALSTPVCLSWGCADVPMLCTQ